MVRNEDDTSIPLKKSTRKRLGDFGHKNETWDSLLNRLADEASKVPTLESQIKELETKKEELGKTIFELNSDLYNIKTGRSTLREFRENMSKFENVKCEIKLDGIKTINYEEE